MVQNQVTVLGCNRPNGAFRQARPLAEGQTSADVKHDFTIPPPRQQRQLAEGVEFPERYADFSPFAPSFGGGGRISREKMQVLVSSRRHLAAGVLRSEVPPDWVAILNHAAIKPAAGLMMRR